MKHQVITLPEHHEHYPHLCGNQSVAPTASSAAVMIFSTSFSRWRSPKVAALSYHVEYDSLVRRWANKAALPRELSSVLNSTRAEPNYTSLPGHHSCCYVGIRTS